MFFPDAEIIRELHRRVVNQSGGGHGLRDAGVYASALAQPEMTFGGQELYPTVVEKAAMLCFCLVMNHPFVDGNKRIGHAAMELVLRTNGSRIVCGVDEQERVILSLAAGEMERDDFFAWVREHVQPVTA